MTYIVRYRLLTDKMWTTVWRVDGDGFVEDKPQRFIHKKNGAMIIIPDDALIRFSPNRERVIAKNIANETGQQ